jgi:hypothetical protein
VLATRFAALHCLLKLGGMQPSQNKYQPPEHPGLIHTFLGHNILSTQEALAIWNERRGLTLSDHLGQSLLLFEYIQHVWRHRGDSLFNDTTRRMSHIRYRSSLPADIRTAATGVGLVDAAIRQLYQSGLITPVQQSWVAAYAVNMRKVDWRVGARWMHGHLLTGSLPSVHLEWQRVAGAPGQAPVVFEATAMSGEMNSIRGTCQHDLPRDSLLRLAESPETIPAESLRPMPLREPRLHQHPSSAWTTLTTALPPLSGSPVTLVHPWALGPREGPSPHIGIIHLPFHLNYPWSEARWRFVLGGMERICDALWIGDLAQCRQWLSEARSIHCQTTLHPGYGEAFAAAGTIALPENAPFPEPGYLCASFEIYLQAVRQLRPALFESSLRGQVAKLQRRNKLDGPY